MRKMIAIVLCLALVLCGCGSTGASEASLSPASGSSAPSPSEVTPEESPVSQDSTDPAELAKQVWAMADQAEESIYATDYDLSMVIDMEIAGTETSVQTSIRSKAIDSDTNPMAYTKTTTNGEVSETWYGDGTLYQTSSLGSYSVPMSYDDFEEQEDAADEDQAILDLKPENFGQLFATTSDNFYTITFSQPTLETWVAFSDLLGVDDDTVTCSHFDLEGSMQCDMEGNINQVKLDMELSLDIMGIITNMTVSVNQLTMATNEDVTIELPNPEDFAQVSDLSIPTALAAAQVATSAQPSLQYENIWALTLVGETVQDVITQDDIITYVTDENGLQVQWDEIIEINEETVDVSSEVYANGSGVITSPDGESEYEYDDESMLLDIFDFIFQTSETISYGTNFSTEGDTLTYDLDQEYVESQLMNALTAYEVDYLMTEGTLENISGNMLYVVDDSGLLLSQLITLTAQVTYDGELIIITLMDGGDVLAIGSDVVMP